ncbi:MULTISPECIES: hypothetical protein [Burkholderia]|uniref:TetR family transcriptional regulator n=1 Tax=Burkholderia anthinoferrum TaxID=3090833 RepID=A0ABU5WVV0_9BURK|nr:MULTISPECIES: hypothetical protein [Burkholderia]MEB2507332.1 hypothetical protein [Burkholderia anthinoferrum]MEB2535957.1 hypothetical protein [Burkholderia anthinoferrum]MEB2565157.1 hypothetical protein [Burkholderia anthinoferrum]MEB2583162.1 hypothetical protein [Burkholderia anthinoferrum]MBR8348685.1 hypothetical protein [Burkholderia ambifaria]
MHDYTIPYLELTASAERHIRDYMMLAVAAGDEAERASLRASAVSVFAYWLGFVNAARKTVDGTGREVLQRDEHRLLDLVRAAAAPSGSTTSDHRAP